MCLVSSGNLLSEPLLGRGSNILILLNLQDSGWSVEYILIPLLSRKHDGETSDFCTFAVLLFFCVGSAANRGSNAISITQKIGNSSDTAKRCEGFLPYSLLDM